MLRNYLTAALRHLGRNRLYSAITIVGLAIGLCAALMAGLVIDSELRYDRFLPGHEHTYLGVTVGTPPGHAPIYDQQSSNRLATLLKLYSGETRVTRLARQEVQLRHGDIAAQEVIYWADPNAFDVLPLPCLTGDLVHSMERPDSIVLTRSMAEKYFGRADPRGQTLWVNGTHPMTVRAVIADLPATQLEAGIFASGVASFSILAQQDAAAGNADASPAFLPTVRTYLRLSPNNSLATLLHAMPELVQRLWPRKPPDVGLSVEWVPFDRVHAFPAFNPGLYSRLRLIALVGALILSVACVNFVNIYTARAATRAREVAIRKAAGADRRALVSQFVGESLIYVALAAALAVVLVEWGLPHLTSFLQTEVPADWWRDPRFDAWTGVVVLMLGVLVSAYPALVLSSFHPANVLSGLRNYASRAPLAREGLVTLQFAVLIGLMIVAGAVWKQHSFATSEALRVNTNQMLLIRSRCNEAFVTELRGLAGIRGASCTGSQLLGQPEQLGSVARPGAASYPMDMVPIQRGSLELYGVQALAGSLRDSAGPGAGDLTRWSSTSGRFIINQAAARTLGFPSASAAIGQTIRAATFGGQPEDNRIAAVVPDFSFSSVEKVIAPTAYYVAAPERTPLINARLSGHDIPETLAAIDRLWTATGAHAPIPRFFLNDHIQSLYMSLLREAQGFGVFCAVALLLASLGLLGLSASIAERRTREIGIRKATGASTPDIMRLLLFRFVKPVVWANAIAWPVAGYVMTRWLHTFAYHARLGPWIFAGSAVAALAIALLTVSTHSLLAARSNTAAALRYE